jgi:hypothetical protein
MPGRDYRTRVTSQDQETRKGKCLGKRFDMERVARRLLANDRGLSKSSEILHRHSQRQPLVFGIGFCPGSKSALVDRHLPEAIRTTEIVEQRTPRGRLAIESETTSIPDVVHAKMGLGRDRNRMMRIEHPTQERRARTRASNDEEFGDRNLIALSRR